MRKRIAALLATFALAFCLPICTPAAFAASAFDQGGSSMAAAGIESDVTYNAGNLFAVMHPVSNTDIENDLYWAGQTLDASKVNVGTSGHGSILAAGQSITLKNVKVADSVRAAAQDIMIDHAQISNNITVAAQNISLGNDVKANGVYASARTLSISGSYQGGLLVGETVSFDGTVEGDLNIQAQQINIGKNAQVKGQLVLPEGVTVNIADGAQVPNVTYSAPINTAQPTPVRRHHIDRVCLHGSHCARGLVLRYHSQATRERFDHGTQASWYDAFGWSCGVLGGAAGMLAAHLPAHHHSCGGAHGARDADHCAVLDSFCRFGARHDAVQGSHESSACSRYRYAYPDDLRVPADPVLPYRDLLHHIHCRLSMDELLGYS